MSDSTERVANSALLLMAAVDYQNKAESTFIEHGEQLSSHLDMEMSERLQELSLLLKTIEKDTQLHTDIYVAKMHSSESVKRVADALLSLVPTLSKE